VDLFAENVMNCPFENYLAISWS